MVSQLKINLNLVSYTFQILKCLGIYYEKGRIKNREEKYTMKEKEPDKENSHLHMTTDMGEYELLYIVSIFHETKNPQYFNFMNMEIKLHKNHL